MKFLTLTLKNDSIRGYDFVNGEGDLSAEEITDSLEGVLFGNDALFEGEILFTAEYGDKVYAVKRDFASGEITVSCDGDVLSKAKANAVVDGLAALGKKQWKESLSPVDTDAFLKDCADYVEKRLAAMGFDVEELERRSLSYATERDRALSQVEALDELVADESFRLTLDEKIRRAEGIKAELDDLFDAEQAAEAQKADVKKAQLLREELAKEEEKEEDVARLKERLAQNAERKALLPVYKRVKELDEEVKAADEELQQVTKDLDFAESELTKDKALAEEKQKNYAYYGERVNALREEFYKLLEENDDGAVSAAIVEKMGETDNTGVLSAFVEYDKRFIELAKDLVSSRLDYKKRRSIREGIAFETTLEDKRDQLRVINDALRAKKALADVLKPGDEEGNDDFLALYRAKVLCDVYRSEIAAEENKIRENEAAQKKIDEDVAALEKAQSAVATYVERATQKCNELSDRLTGVAARKSFCADVTEMEYGAICPVCNNRITDKADHAHEIDKLTLTEKKLTEELTASRAALTEYSEKSLGINLRLGQLREKRRLSAVYVDSLNASVGRKQDAIKELLAKTGAADLSDLDKKCASSVKGGNAALLSLLSDKLSSLSEETEELQKQADSLKTEIAAMEEDYQNEILPELDGKRAYDYLEEIVAAEQDEDEKIAELLSVDNARSQYLDDLVSGGDPTRVIRAANEVFHEVLSDVRRNEELLQKALDEYDELNKLIEQKTDEFNQKLARADELLAIVESGKKRAEELLSFSHAERIDDETYESLEKELLPEETEEKYAYAIHEHEYLKKSLRAKIDALPTEDAEETTASSDREEKIAEYDALKEEIAADEKTLAASEAAFSLAARKAQVCDELLHKYELTKKLADGEVSDVILPVLNDVLSIVGEKSVAAADGLGIKFVKKAGKGEKAVSLDDTTLAVALNCALNYVTALACGRDAVRFVTVDKRGEEEEAAKKYGVIEL